MEAAGALLRAGADEATVEEAARAAEDPGVAVGKMAEARGIELAGGALRARVSGASMPPEDAVVEGLLREKAPWVKVARASLDAGDPRASVVWARRGLAEAPGEAEALYVMGAALARNGEYAEAEGRLREAVAKLSRSAGAAAPSPRGPGRAGGRRTDARTLRRSGDADT